MSRFIEEAVETTTETRTGINTMPTTEELVEQMVGFLSKSTLTAETLRGKKVKQRERLLGEWLRQGDLGFVFAPRGRGKTWLSMAIAKALASGKSTSVGGWTAQEPQVVLYVDGEMNLDETSRRESALPADTQGRLLFLHHDVLFEENCRSLNLTDSITQNALSQHIVNSKANVLMLDNLSSLFYGLKENEADGWEKVLPWLLDLRRKGVSVIIVHHSGVDGSRMRGTTKREDHAHWVLRLDEAKRGDADDGARFLANFTKCRNCPQKEVPPIEFYFRPNPMKPAETIIEWELMDALEQFRITLEKFGTANATDIAEDIGHGKSYVSKLSRQGVKEGWCILEGRNYTYKAPSTEALKKAKELRPEAGVLPF